MASIDKLKVKLTLSVEQLDSLDDLLELYLEGEGDIQKINRGALMDVRESVDDIMEVVNQRLGFNVVRESNEPKYLM